ncbi:MAG TPA: NAD-dependent epimerase/dehydratase family protein [Steroidobacteraceae bacterium]
MQSGTTPRVALVAGASGMVGQALVRALIAGGEYARVVALTRRPLPFESPRLANRIIRFEAMEEQMRAAVCEDAFCCLGTTRRAAGSAQAFRAVDHDLVLRFARCALAAGAKTLVAVSAVGAAPESRNFYLRVKGETEFALDALRFRALYLMQPSLLLGTRSEWRTAETLGALLAPLLNPLLLGRHAQWRAIRADTVGAAMRAAALGGRPGTYRLTWRAMQSLATTGKLPPRL